MKHNDKSWIGAAAALAAFVAACFLLGIAGSMPEPAVAQSWMPWNQKPERRQVRPPPQPVYPAPRPPAAAGRPGAGFRTASPICMDLERQLARDWMDGNKSRELLPKINEDIRRQTQIYRQGQARLERIGCYEQFFFTRQLRRTRRCLRLARGVETARSTLASLEAQRQQISGAGGRRGRQDEIIRALARHRCGERYQQEASRRQLNNPFSFFWQDNDTDDGYRGAGPGGALPFATYRTMCVRMCDGYYFPVSFSTLPSQFEKDEQACQSRCAAPAELYYYQNPGQAVEQMISFRSQETYTTLPIAFRYRNELVRGCSCKPDEYIASIGEGGPPESAPPKPEPAQDPKDKLRRFGR